MTVHPRRCWLDIRGQRLALDLHGVEPGRRGAIVAHGLNGAPDQPHMVPVIAACLDAGLAVIAPNCRNSNTNGSAGNSQTFTMADAVADLREVLSWAETEAQVSLALIAGHSMGGYAALRIAAELPRIPAVLAISPVTRGNLLIAAYEAERALDVLDRELPAAREEWPWHDLLPLAERITQPVALIVGELDHLTKVAHVAALRDRLPNVVFWRVLDAEPHCPIGPDYKPAVAAALQELI
jgi:pimeloyl-ACP methyl ester carboxylesterase